MLRHPFQAISPERIGKYLIPLTLFTVIFMITLNWISTPLTNPSAPSGIISFELAGDVDSAQAILSSWDVESQLIASLSLGLDYLFLVTYSTTIGMGCVWAAEAFSRPDSLLSATGVFLAWGQWFAALFDGIENAALLKLLFGDLQSPWPQVARSFAILKFSLIGLGLLYISLGAIFKIIHRAHQRP